MKIRNLIFFIMLICVMPYPPGIPCAYPDELDARLCPGPPLISDISHQPDDGNNSQGGKPADAVTGLQVTGSYADSFVIYAWREHGAIWVCVEPAVYGPWFCPDNFYLVQDSTRFDAIEVTDRYGYSFCKYLYQGETFTLSQPGYVYRPADLYEAFALVYEDDGEYYIVNMPAVGRDGYLDFNIHIWREYGSVWMKVEPRSYAPWICEDAFTIIQRGIRYDAVQILDRYGYVFCGNVYNDLVFELTQQEDAYRRADLNNAFTLHYRDCCTSYTIDMPAARSGSSSGGDLSSSGDGGAYGCFIATFKSDL